MASKSIELEPISFDSVELEQLKRTQSRRQQCVDAVPKLLFGVYLVAAVSLTFLCVSSPSFRPFFTVVRTAEEAQLRAQSATVVSWSFAPASAASKVDDTENSDFSAQYSCSGNDKMCNDNYGNYWCCPNVDSCDENYDYCDTLNVGLIVGIIVAIWVGPLLLYLLIIAFIRMSNAERFNRLAESGQYQSWVIVSGCFQMAINRSSGDAEFNQAVFNLVNAYGGCGDECLMHSLGICCFGACYPCCMCCVSASRNQTKVSTIQSALAFRGYNTNVQFLSSVIPACCNSIFIGKLGAVASNVVIVSGGGAMAVAGAPLMQQGYPQYASYGAYQQPISYQQAPVAYTQQPQPAAPAYQPPQMQGYGAVPPEVNKP